MLVKGDARPERQSSWRGALRYVRSAFSGFVLLHLAGQAYRAATPRLIPEPGFELHPGFVAAVLVLVWLPFTLTASDELRHSTDRVRRAAPGQERALRVVEPLALGLVLLFTLYHGVGLAWPLLSGALAEGDARVELLATLSQTAGGLPLEAFIYLCGVGLASFCAVRQTLQAWPQARPRFARAVVALGVLACLLGSYAVIRCASGAIWS